MSDRILIVDDEHNIQRSLEMILGGEGFDVTALDSGEACLELLERERPQAIFLDINLPGIDGLETLRRIRGCWPEVPVVIISGHATIERAVDATRLGAFDFVEKPFSRDRILLLARNATEAGRLKRELARLGTGKGGTEILGESDAIRALRDTIAQVAPTDSRVLITGESGTGKELIAAALHRGSIRADKPFVRVNCAAIAEDLIEAELFGAVKGAYTGAIAGREGRFAAADGGTILLDEIGDMSLRAQAKVLRVLQEGEYEPVGSTETKSVDLRVLAATHQDLRELAAKGRFREDLLFRLNVIPIHAPPLREREGDVVHLATRFLTDEAERHELPLPEFGPAALKLLDAHDWPGNIRELKNIVERLVILCRGREIRPDDLGFELRGDPRSAPGATGGSSPYAKLPLREAKDRLERDMIAEALQRHAGNVTRAAAELGLERTHLHKRIKLLGLRDEPTK